MWMYIIRLILVAIYKLTLLCENRGRSLGTKFDSNTQESLCIYKYIILQKQVEKRAKISHPPPKKKKASWKFGGIPANIGGVSHPF